MSIARTLAAIAIALAAIAFRPAQAETFHTCAGFIDSVPATITTQGVWCLRKDLSTAITTGMAITIAANNVTIDCNNFKLGGLSAGASTFAQGIFADARQNAAVRNCAIRGFIIGINLQDGAGHLVEDNRLDNNLYMGIRVTGENNMVQRNRVYDTGGSPWVGESDWSGYGILAEADILDNTVSGVFGVAEHTYPVGIYASGPGTEVGRNRVSRLSVNGGGAAVGIEVRVFAVSISDNRVATTPAVVGHGIRNMGYLIIGGTSRPNFCARNIVYGFTLAPIANCADAGGNASHEY